MPAQEVHTNIVYVAPSSCLGKKDEHSGFFGQRTERFWLSCISKAFDSVSPAKSSRFLALGRLHGAKGRGAWERREGLTDVDRKILMLALHEPEKNNVAKLLGMTHCTHTRGYQVQKQRGLRKQQLMLCSYQSRPWLQHTPRG